MGRKQRRGDTDGGVDGEGGEAAAVSAGSGIRGAGGDVNKGGREKDVFKV